MTWPTGSSGTATRMRAYEWAATPLGPIDRWPASLRRTVDLLLANPLPMALLWGDDLVQIFNDPYTRLLGQLRNDGFGCAPQGVWPDFEQLHLVLTSRIRAGEPVLIDEMLCRHAGSGVMEDHWYMIAYSPVRGDEDAVDGILLTVLETTEQKKAAQRLRQGDERHAFLLRLSDAMRPLADPVEVQRTAMAMVNDRMHAVRSLYIEMGADGDLMLAAEGMDCATERRAVRRPVRVSDFGTLITSAFREGRPVVVEDGEQDVRVDIAARNAQRRLCAPAWIGLPLFREGALAAMISVEFAAPRRCTEEELHLLADVAGRVWDAVERARAETAMRKSEERLQLAVAELQHRVRNILTVVRSTFTRTMEGSGETEDMADHFRGRLDALARTQVIVAQTPAGTADLENLIREELISVGVADGPNVRIVGPDVLLNAPIAEALGLAIHELTTNALKYGALRVDGGRLEIAWSLRSEQHGASYLDFCWHELGVPAIGMTSLHEGYGRELIEQALPYRLGAVTNLEFRGGGIRCSISVPLSAAAA